MSEKSGQLIESVKREEGGSKAKVRERHIKRRRLKEK